MNGTDGTNGATGPTGATGATGPTGTSDPNEGDRGNGNTSEGNGALFSLTTGFDNTAMGYQALYSNTDGPFNTANGFQALNSNTSGRSNTATGGNALFANDTGANNTANGVNALSNNTNGNSNTADGFNALNSNTTGNANIALGNDAGRLLTTGDNNIDIGHIGVADESNTIRIGTGGTQNRTFIAGIFGTPVVGFAVAVNFNGQLGLVVSSERFKDEIKPMDKASEAILSLKPVTFRYKHELDPKSTSQFGLVAEEVEKVDPDLIVRDAEGKVYSVRYDAVNVMLLNEFLKEHRKVEELEAKLAQQQKEFTARLNEQDARIQRVNDKVELGKPAPRSVANNP
jgi:hypothetical protein